MLLEESEENGLYLLQTALYMCILQLQDKHLTSRVQQDIVLVFDEYLPLGAKSGHSLEIK